MTPEPVSKLTPLRGWPWALGIAIFWMVLPWLGLPGPHMFDDTVYVAPALEFAQGHPMTAHIMRDVCDAAGLSAERWLCYPPVYQQLLGSWLGLFGISPASMLWFQAVLNLVTCGALLAIYRRFGVHACWGVPVAVVLFAAQFRTWGLRPEGLGLTLLALGVASLCRRDLLGSFLSGAFLTASGAVVQQAGIYGALLLLVGLGDALCGPPGVRLRRIAALGAGICLPAILFLVGIGWNLPGFLRVYKLNLNGAGGLGVSRISIVATYWQVMTGGREWVQALWMAPLTGIVAVAVFGLRDRFQRMLMAVLAVGITANLLLVQAGTYRISFIYTLIAAAAFGVLGNWRGPLPAMRPVLAFGLVGSIFVLSLPSLIGWFSQLPSNADAIRKVLAGRSYRAIYFDDDAAWYLFEWHLPDKAQSFVNSRRHSGRPAQEGELFVVRESEYRNAPVRLFGHESNGASLNCRRWELVDFRGHSLLTGDHVGLKLNGGANWFR